MEHSWLTPQLIVRHLSDSLYSHLHWRGHFLLSPPSVMSFRRAQMSYCHNLFWFSSNLLEGSKIVTTQDYKLNTTVSTKSPFHHQDDNYISYDVLYELDAGTKCTEAHRLMLLGLHTSVAPMLLDKVTGCCKCYKSLVYTSLTNSPQIITGHITQSNSDEFPEYKRTRNFGPKQKQLNRLLYLLLARQEN